jgi:alkylated DNA repair dioxygenase AlkB
MVGERDRVCPPIRTGGFCDDVRRTFSGRSVAHHRDKLKVQELMPSTETNTPHIPGLKYFANYIDDAEEAALLQAIDGEPWRNDLKRRVQHYGWRYDYKARTIDPYAYLGPLPTWTKSLVERLIGEGHMSAPDQLIVNEYAPGQGSLPT